MSSLPVINPVVPYLGPIPGGLQVGKTITIYGIVPSNANWFQFDFAKPGKEIPFHINVRFDENCIVRNSYLNGCWGHEEREPKYIPMQRGQGFELMCLVEQNCYKLAVNGRHFIEYQHRDAFMSVTTLAIGGTIHISRIEYRDNLKFPFPAQIPGYQPQVCTPGPVLPVSLRGNKFQPVYNPALPFYYPLRDGLQPGTIIYISGRPSVNPDKFSINFQCGPSTAADIALHINPRFNQMAVVRNSRIDNNWGAEECHGPFTFQKGITFDLGIEVQQSCYSIFLNGLPFCTFLHRIRHMHLINMLTIDGDVHISSIQFK